MNLHLISKLKFILNFHLLFLVITFFGQESNDLIKMNGSIGISYENYSYSIQDFDNFRPKYPDNLLRINADGLLQITHDFSIPFGMNISNQKVSYNLPSLPEEGIINYVRNPRNNFHIDPKYKWIKANIGSHTPKYSSFTTGDIQIFGIGVSINPGKFIFTTNYGISQYAIEPDITLNIPGSYKQKILSTRIGYGKINGTKVTLNFVKIKDDINSVQEQPIHIKPKEGISLAPLVEVPLTKQLKIITETAASIFTSDIMASNTIIDENLINSTKNFLTINNSTTLDFAHTTSLEWDTKKIHLGGEIKYIGPSFLSAGYRNIETDIIDYKLKTGFKLSENKYNISGVIGVRTNNIKSTKLNKNNRFIGNLNLLAQFTENLSININYSNFGFKNNALENTYRIQMVNNSFSLAPSYQIKSKTLFQQINSTFSLNSFNQYDILTNSFIDTNTKTVNANYTISFIKIPISLGANFLYLKNTSPLSALQLNNFGINANYKFFQKKMNTQLVVGLSNIKREAYSADNRINLRLKLNYKINKTLESRIVYNLNNNQYGSYRPNAVSNENKLKFSLIKKF